LERNGGFSIYKGAIKSEELAYNIPKNISVELNIPDDFNYTQPYYLNEKGTVGMYRVDQQQNIGKPDVIRQAKVTFLIEINGVTIPFERNIVYKYNDEVKGEVYQPLDIVPVVTATLTEKVYIFNSDKSKTVTLKITAGKDSLDGTAQLTVPEGWSVMPASIPFHLNKKEKK